MVASPSPSSEGPPRAGKRRIVQAEARAWLLENPAEAQTSIVTSLPDLSEFPSRELESWRAWFIDSARHVIRWVPEGGVVIFFLSDIRHHGAWIDKSHLIGVAVDEEKAFLRWHKIVCRHPPDSPTCGRPSYSHMLCVSRSYRAPSARPSPDVLSDAGFMPWSKAMGVNACLLACRYLLEETETRVVVDPFCGHGTVLAVANALGLDAVGVDLGARKCKAARRLVIDLESLRPEIQASPRAGDSSS